MKAIINTNIVMTDHVIPNAGILVEGDRIVDFGRHLPIGEIEECYDARGAYTGPGLIDIHTHADGKTFFTEDPIRAAATLLRHGVTGVLPALYFSATYSELLEQIATIRTAILSGKAPNILGLYMEAPYLNPKFGCNRESNPWKDKIDRDVYFQIIKAVQGLAKVWCLAPEREGIEEFVKDIKARDEDVVFSVAHSEATPEQIEKLMKYGLCLATHHTNATGTIQRHPECRSACVDETVLYRNEIYAELICDKTGIHVEPYMLRLIKKIKGDDRIILISDSFVEHGPIPEGYEEADDINFDFSGEIAGTKLTLDAACRNMMNHTGASLCQVFRYASANPAKLLSLTDCGEIAVGKKANLVTVDAGFHVKKVMLNGGFCR